MNNTSRSIAAMVCWVTSNSELIAFKPGEKQYEELARIKVSDSPIYPHPVISGKRIFVKDGEAVTMWSID